MAISVVINGSTYDIPEQGQSPPWGKELTDVLVALAAAANSASGPSDIPLTSFNVANNQVAAANVIGLTFDTSQVRSAIISYSIYRVTSLAELSEVGQIYVTYKSIAGTWELAQDYDGDSGVTFTITNAGQVQFTSTSLAGTGYSAKMKFKAVAFLQA